MAGDYLRANAGFPAVESNPSAARPDQLIL